MPIAVIGNSKNVQSFFFFLSQLITARGHLNLKPLLDQTKRIERLIYVHYLVYLSQCMSRLASLYTDMLGNMNIAMEISKSFHVFCYIHHVQLQLQKQEFLPQPMGRAECQFRRVGQDAPRGCFLREKFGALTAFSRGLSSHSASEPAE